MEHEDEEDNKRKPFWTVGFRHSRVVAFFGFVIFFSLCVFVFAFFSLFLSHHIAYHKYLSFSLS